MPLCQQRSCGCSISSSTLNVTGSGTGPDPWMIDIPLDAAELPYYTFASTTARDLALPSPAEGQDCYIQNLDEKHHYTGTSWKVWEKRATAYTPTVNPGVGNANGNASIYAVYQVAGGRVFVHFNYVLGSSTFFGNTPFNMQVSMPLTPAGLVVGARNWGGSAWYYDTATQILHPGSTEIQGNNMILYNVRGGATPAQSFQMYGGATSWPFVWGQTDELVGDISYSQPV
jgi:hypothetical protein